MCASRLQEEGGSVRVSIAQFAVIWFSHIKAAVLCHHVCAFSAWFSLVVAADKGGKNGFSVDMFYVPHQLPSETRTISSSHHVVDLLLAVRCVV